MVLSAVIDLLSLVLRARKSVALSLATVMMQIHAVAAICAIHQSVENIYAWCTNLLGASSTFKHFAYGFKSLPVVYCLLRVFKDTPMFVRCSFLSLGLIRLLFGLKVYCTTRIILLFKNDCSRRHIPYVRDLAFATCEYAASLEIDNWCFYSSLSEHIGYLLFPETFKE